MRTLLALTFVFLAGAGQAQDVGLVDLLSGQVSYTPPGGKADKVKAYMKVREGDRFQVPKGAQVRVVYFDGGRQERWTGPAGFQAGRIASKPISGKPAEVLSLPANVPQRIARVPELMQNARLGGVQLRSVKPSKSASEQALREARANYDTLRTQLPKDDITPELYLYSVLTEHGSPDELRAVIVEMQRKQPDSEEVKWLSKAVR